MIDNTSLLFFVAASLALLLAPGPAVIYIVARSIDQGRKAGIVSALGIGTGGLVHVFAAALGLSALLVTSATAFTIVKYLGAVYLIYLGITTLLRKSEPVEDAQPETHSLYNVTRQSIIVGILNPKTALFFFSFLPQFVDPTQGSIALQFTLLGIIFSLLAVLIGLAYAIIAGTLSDWLRSNPVFLKAQQLLSGSVYIFLGVTTALSGADSQSS